MDTVKIKFIKDHKNSENQYTAGDVLICTPHSADHFIRRTVAVLFDQNETAEPQPQENQNTEAQPQENQNTESQPQENQNTELQPRHVKPINNKKGK